VENTLPKVKICRLFAFSNHEHLAMQEKGWGIHSSMREFKRMGLVPFTTYRLCKANENKNVSHYYPPHAIVPNSVTDWQIAEAVR